MTVAVVLFNLGGPDSISSVEPFLRNLFSDSAILPLPTWLRRPVAWAIARRRAPVAQKIYQRMGGCSPLLAETRAQASQLETVLARRGLDARVFVAMRAWHPRSRETARAIADCKPESVVLLPLYPQFSTTTTASSLRDWRASAAQANLRCVERRVCCYPWDTGFVSALVQQLQAATHLCKPEYAYRILFSAHGLPQRTIARGDPYQWQMERTAEAVGRALTTTENIDWRLSYQSRVGPLKWLEPTTESEVRRAGRERKGLVVVPIAFVSEHAETVVELDIDYAEIARDSGVPHYLRVSTVRTNSLFIEGLAELVLRAAVSETPVTCGAGRICPARFASCGMTGEHR